MSVGSRRPVRARTTFVATWLLAVTACAPPGRTPVLLEPSRHPGARPDAPLKVHLHNGDLLVLRRWVVEGDTTLRGDGHRFDRERATGSPGSHAMPLDSVALLETSARREADGLFTVGTLPLATLTVLSAAVTGICLADPKSCFGSCPTFYVASGDGERLVAEGFSSSIARVLEARDVDALPAVTGTPGPLTLTMRNEALETHAVRSVHLLAVPVEEGGQVFVTPDGDFVRALAVRPPTGCVADEGDCLTDVAVLDGRERRSWTDPTDLGARETLVLTLPRPLGPSGLVISARHTFVSTFLFYQTLAYLGRQAGPVMAELERGNAALRDAIAHPMNILGRLEIEVLDPHGRWVPLGAFEEAGPLAADRQVIPLPDWAAAGPVQVRLHLVRGYWRIDEVALATLGDPVIPIRLAPEGVTRAGEAAHDAARTLLDPSRHLVTQPGDAYGLTFALPEGTARYSLFLESEGYYYEWMRQEWLAEENPAAAAAMLTRPDSMFRQLAPEFKEREARMEETFWQTRIARRLP